jgi:hypothetical protein
MYTETREVELRITIPGSQAIRGSYSHYHRVEKDGKELNGVRIERKPEYCEAKKNVHLGTSFVAGAIAEAPEYLHMRPHIWRKLPENKRIAIHVGAYVRATHPEHRSYEMEIF